MAKKKKIEKFEKLLKRFVKNQDLIKIESTAFEGESSIYGLILKNSTDFLHLTETDEFIFNGEVIIKKDQFDSIRCNEMDIAYKEILSKEGKLKATKLKKTTVDLTDWTTIFKDLKKQDIHVIVECEDLDDPTFTIGPIENVNSKNVEIRYYDATGILDKKLTKVKFKDITLLKFNDRYSKTFRKYLK